jgi:hypothetical protein
MDWNDLAWKLRDGDAYEQEIAYRVAARSLLLLAGSMDRAWSTQSVHGKNLLRFIRSVLLARVALDNPQEDFRDSLRETYELMSTVNVFDQSHRISRAMSGVFIGRTRQERLESLRVEIQASKDGIANFKVKERKPAGFLDLDIWDHVSADYEYLRSDRPKPLPAFQNKEEIGGAWTLLGENIGRYDQSWYPWAAWLEYRLFGDTFSGLAEEHWQQFERHAAELPRGIWDDPLQLNQKIVQKLNEIINERQDELEEIEAQSKFGLTFDVDDDKIVLTSRTRAPIERTLKPLIDELMEAIESLLDASTDNSSADIRLKAKSTKSRLEILAKTIQR